MQARMKYDVPVHLNKKSDCSKRFLGSKAVHQRLSIGLSDLQLGLGVIFLDGRSSLSRRW